MAEKRTKADRLERQTEQLGKRVDRHPDEIEKKKATREGMNQAAAQTTQVPKSDEPTLLIPIEQKIQQRAYEHYERRGRTDGLLSPSRLHSRRKNARDIFRISGTLSP